MSAATTPRRSTGAGAWRSPVVLALCGFCAGTWVAASAPVPAAVGFGLAVVACGLTMCRWRGRGGPVVVVWAVLGFGLAAFAHGRVAAATVTEPRPFAGVGIVGSDLDGGRQVVRLPIGRVRLLGLQSALPLGARVSIRGMARPPPSDPDLARRLHYSRIGADAVGAVVEVREPPPLLLGWASAVRTRMHEAVTSALGDERGGLLLGLLDGDDTSLSPETVDEFRRGGLSHLLVVSGSNLAFVLGAVGFLLGRLPIGRRPRLVIGAVVLAFYVMVTRAEPSVMRAAAMAATAFTVSWTGRLRDPVRACATAVLALVVLDPFLAASVGFQLSVAATAGILALAGPITERLRGLGVPQPVALAMAVSTAAQAAVSPLLVWHFGRVSAVGLVANTVAVPLAGGLTVAGAALGVAGWFWPAVFSVLALPVGVLARIGSLAARMPGADLEVPRSALLSVLLAGGAAVALVRLWRRGRVRAALAMGAAATVALAVAVGGALTTSPCPGVTFVDVGQGDATLLVGGDGTTVLVDTGRDPAKLDGALRSLGADRVDVLVLTHGDSDHVAATTAILQHRRPGLVIEPSGMNWPSDVSRSVERRIGASGVVVRQVADGDVVTAGDVRLEVLHPELQTPSHKPNDVALVAVADVMGMRVLLSSDATAEVQHRVLGKVGDVDVAKVPHHGSRDQDPRLAAEARAEISVVPVGPNSYGHPSREALDIYGGPDANEYRTDRSGTVQVCATPDQGRLQVRTAR